MIYLPTDIINILFSSKDRINDINLYYFNIVKNFIPEIYNKYFYEKTFKDFYFMTYEGKDSIKYDELDSNILDITTSKFNNEFNIIKNKFKEYIEKYKNIDINNIIVDNDEPEPLSDHESNNNDFFS